MEPNTLYIERSPHGRYFIAHMKEGKKVEFIFKNNSYEHSWQTMFGVKNFAKKLAENLNYDKIIIKK